MLAEVAAIPSRFATLVARLNTTVDITTAISHRFPLDVVSAQSNVSAEAPHEVMTSALAAVPLHALALLHHVYLSKDSAKATQLITDLLPRLHAYVPSSYAKCHVSSASAVLYARPARRCTRRRRRTFFWNCEALAHSVVTYTSWPCRVCSAGGILTCTLSETGSPEGWRRCGYAPRLSPLADSAAICMPRLPLCSPRPPSLHLRSVTSTLGSRWLSSRRRGQEC